MSSKKIVKMIFSAILVFACLILFQTISKAASFSASISKTTVTVGDTFTVTVKANNAAGMYSVTNSNSNVSLSSGSKSEFIENQSATVKFKATKAGTVTITAKAVDMTDLDNSSKNVTGSKTFTVTIKEKSSSGGSSSEGSTTTKPTFTSTNKKVYAKDDINLRSSWSTSSSATPVSKGTEMTLTGTSSKSVNGYVWYRVSYKGSTKYVASSLVTTTKTSDKKDEDEKEEKDDSKATNTNLKSLTVTPTGLSPAFAAGTTEYTMTVGSNIDEIDINAVAEDKNASVKVTGNKDLKIGTNKITITVTAGKETKTYNINVTKEDKKQLQLSELLVEGLPLQPEFDSNIYEYTLTLDRSDISEINITATPSKESAEVEIVGNTDLVIGENTVTILVKSADGEDVSTYQIIVTIPEPEETAIVKKANEELYLYIGIGVGALIVLIIIIAIVKRHRREDEENMYYGMYNPKGNDEDNDKASEKQFDTIQKDENVDLNELTKLDDEDLPKSLRKDKEINDGVDFSSVSKIDSEMKEKVDVTANSDRSKRIDEFYNNIDDEVKPRKRGKHSK